MALQTSDSATLSGSIPAPLEQVFALLADPDKMPHWLLGCRAATADSGIRKGSRLQADFGRGPIELLITDFAPPNIFGWAEQGSSARQGSHLLFKLAFAGASTTVTLRYTWSFKTLRAWFLGSLLRRRSARRVFDTAIVELRRMLGR